MSISRTYSKPGVQRSGAAGTLRDNEWPWLNHARYNPVERVFGVLENYWNGDPLETVEKALGMAEGMTCKGVHPTATLIETAYPKGVRLTKNRCNPTKRASSVLPAYANGSLP